MTVATPSLETRFARIDGPFLQDQGIVSDNNTSNASHRQELLPTARTRLEATACVVGLFKDWECPTREGQLFPGDLLAIYTDGITEAFNHLEEEFGEDRLIGALQRHRDRSPADVVAAIIDEVRQFSPHEQYDDVTLIVARCKDDVSR